MSITTVAELRSALGVGTLYSDATLQSVCDAADNVLLPFLWKNQQSIIAHGNVGTVGTLYFDVPIMDVFYIGQSVTISGAGTVTFRDGGASGPTKIVVNTKGSSTAPDYILTGLW